MTHNNRLNNLDDLIINQGYMSQRTKSPRRLSNNEFFENEMMMYNNNNNNNTNNINMNTNNMMKMNSGRDMSPNKIVAKSKPLVSNNNVNQISQQQNQKYSNNNNSSKLLQMGNNYQQQVMVGGNNNYTNYQQQQQQKQQPNNNLNKNVLYPPPTLQQQLFNTTNNNNNTINNNNNTNWRNPIPTTNTNTNNLKSPRTPQENIISSQQCSNHLNKRAQYMTQSDGEVIYYCETCAAKLAAQRFEVIKLPLGNFAIGGGNNNNLSGGLIGGFGQLHHQQQHLIYNNTNTNTNSHITTKPSPLPYRPPRQLPSLPQYKSNPVYQSILQFLKQIYTVQKYHYQTHAQLQHIDQHYTQQISMVDQFYIQLMEILSKMHNDHVSDLHAQYKKHSQMRDIYVNQIYENLQTIQQIVNDLDQNFQTVMTKITNQDIQFFNQALQKNRSNIRFFCNQIQQQKQMLGEVVHYKEERMMEMVGEFEEGLVVLWEEKEKLGVKNQRNLLQNVNVNKYQSQGQPQNQGTIRQLQQQPPKNNNQSNPINLNNILHQQTNNNRQQQNLKKNDQQLQQHKQQLNVLQIHQQNQPKPSNLARDFQGKGACRQIFGDDQEENITQQVSPKFKNI